MEIVLILFIFIEVALLFVYGIFIFKQIHYRNNNLLELDENMLNTSRILSIIGVVGISLIFSKIKEFSYFYYALLQLSILFLVIGLRLNNLSIKVKEENRDTFYYKWDQWLEKMYGRYLKPLWPKK